MFQSTRPRGARLSPGPTTPSPGMFQSTRPRGARLSRAPVIRALEAFQSTRPRGARQKSVRYFSWRSGFNPRAHAGRDQADRGRQWSARVSIHAPTRGATKSRQIY